MSIFCEAAAEWDHDWDANGICLECGTGGLTAAEAKGSVPLVDEIEMFEGTVYVVGCWHEGRYPQVDPFQADVWGDYTLFLLCDDCADEAAADI